MRTYSESEARDVFARAAKSQQAESATRAPGVGGLSIAELQEIGREAGLDPAHVAAAAASLGAPPPASPTMLGVPVKVSRTRILNGSLSDETWEELIGVFRQQFGGPGSASQVGRIREWTSVPVNGAVGGNRVHVAVRPTRDGRTEVTVEQLGMRENALGIAALTVTFGFMTFLFGIIPLIKDKPAVWALVAFFALVTLSFGLGGQIGMRRWARRLDARFEAVLDRIDLLARDAAPAPQADFTSAESTDADDVPAGRLSLDVLDEPHDPSEHSSTRDRERS